MSSKLTQLERVKRLRDLRKGMHEADLAKAQGVVRRTELQIATARELHRDGANAVCAALMAGDRAEWWLSETAALAAQQRGVMLAGWLRERVEYAEAARGRWVTSRREAEQASAMTAELRRVFEMEQARRAQATSDDRFAARACWRKAQEARR